MFEKDLPGGNTAGFNADATIGRLPLESCETINRAWGYNKNDKQFKSTKQLVHYLIRAAGHNANFLLNVGPMPTGRIQPEFGERLREIGLWTQKNGESVYGTRGGPMPPQKWGVTTQKGSKVYVHLLDVKPNDIISLSWDGISPTVRNNGGTVLGSGERIGLAYIESGRITMKVPDKLDPIDTVIVLDTAKKAE
jgi:alpha-L-fucosidase